MPDQTTIGVLTSSNRNEALTTLPMKHQSKRSHFQLHATRVSGIGATLALVLLAATAHVDANSLDETIKASQAHDKSLVSANSNRMAAAENVDIARSRLLPQVNVQGFRQRLNQTTIQNTSLGPQANVFQGESYQYQLSLRQSLIRPRDWSGYTLGQQQALYGEFKYVSARSDLFNRAAGTWLDVLAALSMKDLYQEAIKTVTESATQERMRFEKGDGTKDNMIEAQAQLLQAQAMLQDSQFNLEAKLSTHRLFTGDSQSQWNHQKLPNEDRVVFDDQQKASLLERIKVQSPELMAAKAIEGINASKVTQALADHLPTLDLVASATRAQNDTTNTLGYTYQNQQVGFQLTLPLYAGGGLDATRRQAVATLEASVADRESLEFRIEAQFENDWATQAGLLERTKAARSLMFAALEQKKAAFSGVNKGLRTWSDVASAELLLARRSADLITIQINLFKTQARILSLLPADDDAWASWIRSIDVASQQ